MHLLQFETVSTVKDDAMGRQYLKPYLKRTTVLTGLLLIGFDAVAILVALTGNAPAVLIPFAGATLISCGAIWWAQRRNANVTMSAPPGTGKDRPK